LGSAGRLTTSNRNAAHDFRCSGRSRGQKPRRRILFLRRDPKSRQGPQSELLSLAGREEGMRRRSRGFIGCLKRKIRQQIPAELGLARSVVLRRSPARLREGEESRGHCHAGPGVSDRREKGEGKARGWANYWAAVLQSCCWSLGQTRGLGRLPAAYRAERKGRRERTGPRPQV